MKVAHINYLPVSMAGINKKISYQAQSAKELGLDIDFIVLNTVVNKEEDNLLFIKIKLSNNSFVQRIQKLFFVYDLISKNVDLENYDYIIIRYMVPDISSIKFIRTYGNKVITEHHTNELVEILSYQGFSNKIRFYLEKFRGVSFLKNVSGLIGVTEEIRKIEISRSGNIPSTVISNGINVKDTSFTKFNKKNQTKITLIFVASYTANWHGIDRLLSGLKRYRGNQNIELLLIGGIKDEYIKYVQNINKEHINIKILGKKYNKELDDCFLESCLAISSLALHRNKMHEACVLKTREYIARGIPFVYGYDDTDLTGKEPFALKVPANDEPLDIEEIIRFSQEVSEIKDISQTMRDFALKKLDWKIKIQQMYDFVESIDKNK
jgi:hypothetical protein